MHSNWKMKSVFILLVLLSSVVVEAKDAVLDPTFAREWAPMLHPSEEQADRGTCTVTINIYLDNGTTILGKVVIEGEDMKWWRCALIKIYDLFSGDF